MGVRDGGAGGPHTHPHVHARAYGPPSHCQPPQRRIHDNGGEEGTGHNTYTVARLLLDDDRHNTPNCDQLTCCLRVREDMVGSIGNVETEGIATPPTPPSPSSQPKPTHFPTLRADASTPNSLAVVFTLSQPKASKRVYPVVTKGKRAGQEAPTTNNKKRRKQGRGENKKKKKKHTPPSECRIHLTWSRMRGGDPKHEAQEARTQRVPSQITARW